ncbi:GNAT family N-acetyltransferase [Alicyclobacillus macrosporangiidus]
MVRRLSPADYPVLARWLNDPRVLKFYEGRDNPYDLAKVEQVFGSKTNRSVTACIVSYKGRDIGYVQFYPVPEPVKVGLGMNPRLIVYGMDQFIGEPDYWNRGIGTALVKSVADYVRTNLGADKIVMDPQAWNTRAIRCYEKAGFRKAKWLPKHEWHEGEWRDCWLVVCPGEEDEIVYRGDGTKSTV